MTERAKKYFTKYSDLFALENLDEESKDPLVYYMKSTIHTRLSHTLQRRYDTEVETPAWSISIFELGLISFLRSLVVLQVRYYLSYKLNYDVLYIRFYYLEVLRTIYFLPGRVRVIKFGIILNMVSIVQHMRISGFLLQVLGFPI